MSKSETVSDGYRLALDDFCARYVSRPPCRKRGPASLRLDGHRHISTQEVVHLLLGNHLVDAQHLLKDNKQQADDDDPAFEASFCARYQACPATQENLSAMTVLDLLQKRTVHFCDRFNPVTGASAPPPLLFLIR